MDIKSNATRTTMSFALSVLFHVSLVAGGAVAGAFLVKHQDSQAKGKQNYEVTVSEETSSPASASVEAASAAEMAPAPTHEVKEEVTPSPEPTSPPVVAEDVVAPKPVAAKPKAKKVAKATPAKPAKKIITTDFSEAQTEPQAIVEVNENLNEQPATFDETEAGTSQDENIVKTEELSSPTTESSNLVTEEVVNEDADAASTEAETSSEKTEVATKPSEESQKEALEKLAGSSTNTTAQNAVKTEDAASDKHDSNGSNAPAAKSAPQNFLTLKQVPGNKTPSYPNDLRLKQVQGKGQLKYYVNKDGRVGQMELTQSSGSDELDQIAMDSFSKYRFVPGQEGYTIHNFEFSLKGPAEAQPRRLRTSYNK